MAQTIWGNFIKKHPPEKSEVWELKYTKGTSLAFDVVKEHQIKALLAVKGNGLYHKISDQPWRPNAKYSFQLKKPFDCFFIIADAYVVLFFYKPRKPKVFIKIDIDTFLAEKFNSKRKSITNERASEIGESVKIVLN